MTEDVRDRSESETLDEDPKRDDAADFAKRNEDEDIDDKVHFFDDKVHFYAVASYTFFGELAHLANATNQHNTYISFP